MRQIDSTLPSAPMAMPQIADERPPATRAELVQVITRITQDAKMPAGVKHARFVRIPADLYLVAHDVVQRELRDLAAMAENAGQ